MGKKPNGYWSHWKNVRKVLKPVIAELGRFPTGKELASRGHSSVAYAIIKYHGGVPEAQKRMGFDTPKKPRGYWQHQKNVEKELRRICRKLGHFPSQKELQTLGRSTIAHRIMEFYGGFPEAREHFGYTVIKQTSGHWQTWANVESALEEIINNLGCFPTTIDLKDLGKSGLTTGMQDYHGGINAVRERMGYAPVKKPTGYWKAFKKIRKELKQITDELGHFPTVSELRNMGRGDLYAAIKDYHGGIRKVRKKLGYANPTKPSGHWKEWKNVRKVLKKLTSELGHYPSQKEMCGAGYSSVTIAINKHHGGTLEVQKRLGLEPAQKPPRYWTFERVKQSLDEITAEVGEFPSQKWLSENEHKNLVAAIAKYHGGFRSVRERCGGTAPCVPKGHWMQWENIEAALNEMIEELGHFATYKDFKESKYTTVPAAIKKFHGGMDKVRKRVGCERTTTASGYWKKWSNVREILEGIMKELGHFPSPKEMYEAGYSSLPSALHKYHRGVHAAARKMNTTPTIHEAGHWTLDKTLKLCREFVEEHGHFPRQKELNNRNDKYKGLTSGINKHGGGQKVKEMLGVEDGITPQGYWNEEKILEEARKIVEEHGTLPTQKELLAMGHKKFLAAVGRYSGLVKLRRQLGLRVDKVETGYWTEERVLSECRKIVEEHGDLPAKDELHRLGYKKLATRIEKNGGYPCFREKLGLDLIHRPQGYWNSAENTYNEAKKICEKLGHFPSESDLKKHGLSSLTNAARRHFGSFVALRQRIEQDVGVKSEKERLEQVLEAYVEQ